MMLSKPLAALAQALAPGDFSRPVVEPGTEGMTPSALSDALGGRPTPSFHLERTDQRRPGGAKERAGRHLIYRAQFERMNALMATPPKTAVRAIACLPAQTTLRLLSPFFTPGDPMKRFHVHLHVNDLAANIAFYSAPVWRCPTRVEADYAKWMLEDPRELRHLRARRAGRLDPGLSGG